ncbi:hypothetical protein [Cohnella sp. GCM10012308]|uniref:hypothetical protein n=1 Tax=Cohnella sp. GCM10012308 TaxID=3317329 RepID=UPI0036202B5F
MMRISLRHSSGVTKQVKLGFSWTFFFFGLWVPLFRGDFRNFFRIWGLSIVTLGIYGIISWWAYNGHYVRSLLEKGYGPADEWAKTALVDRRIITSNAPLGNAV